MPGIADPRARATLAQQMVASIRRLDYTRLITRDRPISPERANPLNSMFDPERAAFLHARQGQLDEAFWLTFLATHFGKHLTHGWRRLQDVYSGLGERTWTWQRTSADPHEFRVWLLRNAHRIGGGFGNHRRYESLISERTKSTADAIEGYIEWISPPRTHSDLLRDMIRKGGNDPHRIFDEFYKSMRVARFSRLGKFDFLTLVGRLDLAPISPGIAYLKGATGPLRGARLLFGANRNDKGLTEAMLERWLCELDEDLNVGMQVMEDSLCNWQKSPLVFKHFRG